jgi:tRNA(adenine34) deaminase
MNHEFFMRKALVQAEIALGKGEFPVGCILVYENEILASGSRKGTLGSDRNEIDHAEVMALRHLSQVKEKIDPGRVAAYCTLEPCLMCFGALILAGIGKIVYAYEDVMGGATGCDLSKLRPLYQNSPVTVVPNILRRKSLRLFKDYFSNPAHDYWRHSLLATYTLGQ